MDEKAERMGGVGVGEWLRNHIGASGYGEIRKGWVVFKVDGGWIRISATTLDALKEAMNKAIDEVNDATVSTYDGLFIPTTDMIKSGNNASPR